MRYWPLLAWAMVLVAQEPRKVTIPMRDGVELAADIYDTNPAVPKPVLLQRTPYNKTNSAATARRYAAAGYAVVVQDTRGRFESKGEFFPYNGEGQDGFDTTEWVTRQPWSDGRIGMWGASYVGAVQYQAAAEGAPGLAVLAPTATWSSFYRNIYLGGVPRLALIGTAAAGLYPPPAGKSAPPDWYQTLQSLPLADLDLAIGWRIPWLRTILTHPRPDGFWKRLDVTPEIDQLKMPAQHIVGYYDFFLREVVSNFERLRRSGAEQQLILGPWDHGSIGKRTLGEIDFGPASDFDLPGENLAWFDRILKGSRSKIPAIRYFSMGENAWREAASWPPEDAKVMPFYLHSKGKANTRHGDGLVMIGKPASEPYDTFIGDPSQPVPAWPPAMLQGKFAAFWGPVDQGPNADRSDVLVYDSSPLTRELRIAGPIEAHLWVSQTTPDADWVVKLIDVLPNGYAQNLAVGIQRASFIRAPRERPYQVRVDVGHTAALLKPGHRLRIEITGSYFPLFDRNTNTGQGPYSATSLVARQRVHHTANMPSMVLLPIMP